MLHRYADAVQSGCQMVACAVGSLHQMCWIESLQLLLCQIHFLPWVPVSLLGVCKQASGRAIDEPTLEWHDNTVRRGRKRRRVNTKKEGTMEHSSHKNESSSNTMTPFTPSFMPTVAACFLAFTCICKVRMHWQIGEVTWGHMTSSQLCTTGYQAAACTSGLTVHSTLYCVWAQTPTQAQTST